MAQNDKKFLAEIAQRFFDAFIEAREETLDRLANIVHVAGDFVATLPRSDKPHLKAVVDYSGSLEYVTVYGLRYEKGEGLFICTEDQVDNYSIEKGYDFKNIEDFEGEDLDHLNKMLTDLAYFVNIQDEQIILSTTLISILGGLSAYL